MKMVFLSHNAAFHPKIGFKMFQKVALHLMASASLQFLSYKEPGGLSCWFVLKGSHCPALFSTGEASLAVLCPGWGPALQEGRG